MNPSLRRWIVAAFALSLASAPPAEPLETNANRSAGGDRLPQIAAGADGTWIIVWQADTPTEGRAGADYDILFSRSADRGATWSATGSIGSGARVGGEYTPSIATNGRGAWAVVCSARQVQAGPDHGDLDIGISISADNGVTWSPTRLINPDASNPAVRAPDFSPTITMGHGDVWIVAWEMFGGFGADSDIVAMRSLDGGRIWREPILIKSTALTDAASDLGPALAAGRNGAWVAAWSSDDTLDGRSRGDADILVARSTDEGVNWSPPALLGRGLGSSRDQEPALCSDGAGGWFAIWESVTAAPSAPSVLVSRSDDDGRNWSTPELLDGASHGKGFSTDSPQLTRIPGGDCLAIWIARSPTQEEAPQSESIRVGRRREVDRIWEIGGPEPIGAMEPIHSPRIAAGPQGEWIAVWEGVGAGGATSTIFASRSTDEGASWSEPFAVGAPESAAAP